MAGGLSLHGMDHFTVLTTDLDVTRRFYEMFGFQAGPRPDDLPGPGIWFYLSGKAVLHVIGPVKELPDNRRGMLDHMAFSATGLAASLELLKANDIAYRLEKLAEPFGIWQLFFEDPFGARVEFDFPASEPAPEDWRSSR